MIKQIYVMTIITLFLLTACSIPNNGDLKDLYSETDGQFALLTVGREIKLEELKDLEIKKEISKIKQYRTLALANKNYPDLNIKEASFFIVFDREKLVFKTANYKDLIKYLKQQS